MLYYRVIVTLDVVLEFIIFLNQRDGGNSLCSEHRWIVTMLYLKTRCADNYFSLPSWSGPLSSQKMASQTQRNEANRALSYFGRQPFVFDSCHPLNPISLQQHVKDLGDEAEAWDAQEHPEAPSHRGHNGICVVQVKLLWDGLHVGGVRYVSDPVAGQVLTYGRDSVTEWCEWKVA